MMWKARVYDEHGEPKTIPVKGEFEDAYEVEAYLKTIKPRLKFIWAVKQ